MLEYVVENRKRSKENCEFFFNGLDLTISLR